ncbi:uncharacterized protein LOC114325644 isoform X2 [Diabrotica virgifera virgifera]|uniref:Uncharacterized protein LOC114325644 isoform X2 n=1 Tax=Diabrotica virgifera virgifera TaxID=50390 RepID=A0A6P7F1S0_DIAVI|nr:uncharacterized protein LOC114325644 isoform X2 [Diabrotica virgifera virgifera]
MAYSQKHNGLVLVPYFNKAEWEYVAKCLISKSEDKLIKALSILQIWKQRMPILPAGIEGTLSILEAILLDESNIPENWLGKVKASALTTFLNVAVHNDKQGNFNKKVSKSFPKWIIDIRHDFCHGTKEISNDNVKIALNLCFEWILDDYWKKENNLRDYILEDTADTNIIDCLNTYIKLTLNIYKGVTMGDEFEHLMNKANYLASKRYNSETLDPSDLHKVLEETLKQELSNPKSKKLSAKVAEVLVDNKALFHVHLKKDEVAGVTVIPKPFRDLWTKLLNLLFDHGFLEQVLDKLLEVSSDYAKEMAMTLSCRWLCNILDGLVKLKNIAKFEHTGQNMTDLELQLAVMNFKAKIEKDMPEFRDCIEFNSIRGLNTFSLVNLERKMLKKPNKQYIAFLDKVMTFNGYNPEYINFMMLCVKQQTGNIPVDPCNIQRDIYQIKDLTDHWEQIERMDLDEPEKGDEDKKDTGVEIVEAVAHGGRWSRVTNISKYKNCPLGIGPNQSAEMNPHIIMD